MHIHSEGQYILINSRINLFSLFSQALDKEYDPINKFLRDTHEYRKKKKLENGQPSQHQVNTINK